METYYEHPEKATAEQYVASYHYTRTQKIAGAVMVILILFGIIIGITALFMNLINLL